MVADPGALKTFLIADVRGFTRFTYERGDHAAAELTTRFAVMRDPSSPSARRGPNEGRSLLLVIARHLVLNYVASTPSTNSWVTPAANPPESTASVPARVLISSRSLAASE